MFASAVSTTMNFFFNNSFFVPAPVASPPLALSSPSLTRSLGLQSSSPRVDMMQGVETEPQDMKGVETEPEDMKGVENEPEDMKGVENEPEDMEGIELEPEDMEEIEIEMLPESVKMPPEEMEDQTLLRPTLIQLVPLVEPYWDDDL